MSSGEDNDLGKGDSDASESADFGTEEDGEDDEPIIKGPSLSDLDDPGHLPEVDE